MAPKSRRPEEKKKNLLTKIQKVGANLAAEEFVLEQNLLREIDGIITKEALKLRKKRLPQLYKFRTALETTLIAYTEASTDEAREELEIQTNALRTYHQQISELFYNATAELAKNNAPKRITDFYLPAIDAILDDLDELLAKSTRTGSADPITVRLPKTVVEGLIEDAQFVRTSLKNAISLGSRLQQKLKTKSKKIGEDLYDRGLEGLSQGSALGKTIASFLERKKPERTDPFRDLLAKNQYAQRRGVSSKGSGPSGSKKSGPSGSEKSGPSGSEKSDKKFPPEDTEPDADRRSLKPDTEPDADRRSLEPDTEPDADRHSLEPDTEPDADRRSLEPDTEPDADRRSLEPDTEPDTEPELDVLDAVNTKYDQLWNLSLRIRRDDANRVRLIRSILNTKLDFTSKFGRVMRDDPQGNRAGVASAAYSSLDYLYDDTKDSIAEDDPVRSSLLETIDIFRQEMFDLSEKFSAATTRVEETQPELATRVRGDDELQQKEDAFETQDTEPVIVDLSEETTEKLKEIFSEQTEEEDSKQKSLFGLIGNALSSLGGGIGKLGNILLPKLKTLVKLTRIMVNAVGSVARVAMTWIPVLSRLVFSAFMTVGRFLISGLGSVIASGLAAPIAVFTAQMAAGYALISKKLEARQLRKDYEDKGLEKVTKEKIESLRQQKQDVSFLEGIEDPAEQMRAVANQMLTTGQFTKEDVEQFKKNDIDYDFQIDKTTGKVTAKAGEGLTNEQAEKILRNLELRKNAKKGSGPTLGGAIGAAFSTNTTRKFRQALEAEGIDDPNVQNAMIGQAQRESNFKASAQENLNYTSVDRLEKVFGNRLKKQGLDPTTLVNNPEGLAEAMYGADTTKGKELGNIEPGDGYKYRGRGYIQLTGRSNYEQASRALGIDLIKNPDLANDPTIAAQIAAWFAKSRGLDKLQGQDPETIMLATTKAVMGNLNFTKGFGKEGLEKAKAGALRASASTESTGTVGSGLMDSAKQVVRMAKSELTGSDEDEEAFTDSGEEMTGVVGNLASLSEEKIKAELEKFANQINSAVLQNDAFLQEQTGRRNVLQEMQETGIDATAGAVHNQTQVVSAPTVNISQGGQAEPLSAENPIIRQANFTRAFSFY